VQRHRRPEQIAAQLFRSRAIRGRHPDVGQGGRMDPVGIAGVEPAAFEQALYPAGRPRQHNAEPWHARPPIRSRPRAAPACA